MTLDEFVAKVAVEYEETPADIFTPQTVFKEVEEWSSLIALSIIAIADEDFEKTITGADIRQCNTLEELYNLIVSK